MANLTSEKNLHVGNDVIDVDRLKQQYPHLEPVSLSKYSYRDFETILGQDVFHLIRPLEYFKSDQKTLHGPSGYRWVGFRVDHWLRVRDSSRLASKMSQKVRETPSWPINFGVGMKWSLSLQ